MRITDTCGNLPAATILLFILVPVLLFCQAETSEPVFIPSSLLNQAYTSMLVGNFSMAEAQYKAITELQHSNLSAWEGVLWALNAQGRIGETLRISAKLLQEFPESTNLFNYRAYALLNRKRFPESRNCYRLGYASNPENPLAKQIAQEGMAYAYLEMDDYPNYQKHLSAASAVSGIPMVKSKPKFRSSIAYKIPGEDKASYAVSQTAGYESYSLTLGYEDLYIAENSFRQSAKAEFRKQFKPLDISVSGRYMKGTDERVYPAWVAGAEITPKLYLNNLAIKPRIYTGFGHFPRFDVQQVSIKPTLYWRDFVLQYALHGVFMDHESVNADSSHFAPQLSLNKNLTYGFNLGLHGGFGNDTWLVDASGVLIDSFNQNGAYYGISLGKNLFNHLSVYTHYQKWASDDLIYLSVSGIY